MVTLFTSPSCTSCRPIILDVKRLQVGYNEDEIRRFLPRKVRTFQLQEAQRLVD